MWIKRDGSVQGPLWPEEIRDIVTAKLMKVTAIHVAVGSRGDVGNVLV